MTLKKNLNTDYAFDDFFGFRIGKMLIGLIVIPTQVVGVMTQEFIRLEVHLNECGVGRM
jgi:hypothetical protein